MFWICVLLASAYYLINRWLRSLKIDKYSDKYVLITGCDSGFGRDLAIRLDGMGFFVFAGCLTEAGKDDLQQYCSTCVTPFLLDVTKDESIQAALQFVKDNLPKEKGLWAIVNNAGIGGTVAASEMLIKKDYKNALEINLLGPVEITRVFLPLIRKVKGRVVSITSVMGRFAGVNAPYCVSKFGFEAYLDVLRRELYTQGIKVSILEPGFFPTNIVNQEKIGAGTKRAYERSSDDIRTVYGKDYVDTSLKLLQSVKLASDTSAVIDAYVHALTARYPHTRYVVGWDAHLMFIPLTYLPDWLSDWLIHKRKQQALKESS